MDRLFQKITDKIDKEISEKFGPKFLDKFIAGNQNVPPLSPRDVFRFRKQRGINLGQYLEPLKYLGSGLNT